MSVTTVVLVGLVLMTNMLLALLITKSSNQTADKSDKPVEPASTPSTEESAKDTSTPKANHVGKSKYNPTDLDDYMNHLAEEAMKKAYRVMFEHFLGEVKTNQVEFADNDESATPSQNVSPTQDGRTNDSNAGIDNSDTARMSKEQEDKAFDDVRISDVEQQPVSAPMASGASLDEIEESVNTVLDDNASPEAKSRAGIILAKFEGTNLSDIFKSDDTIAKKVSACVNQSIRKSSFGNDKASSRKKEFVIPDKFEDFNPWDLIRKK